MINLNVKSHTSFARNRQAKPVSRMWVATAIIAVATSAWGCSSRVESFDDWLDSTPTICFDTHPQIFQLHQLRSPMSIWGTILRSRGPGIQIRPGSVQISTGSVPVKFSLPPTIECSKFRRC